MDFWDCLASEQFKILSNIRFWLLEKLWYTIEFYNLNGRKCIRKCNELKNVPCH